MLSGDNVPSSSSTSSPSDDSVFSFPFTPTSTTSSHGESIPDDNPSDSVLMLSPAPSVYSLTSSLRAQSFRQEYGREVNNYSEIYRLPADEEEIARLDRQHHMFHLMLGPWVPPLPEILTSDPGKVKSVLDLGCGTGAWAADVARAFPECSVVGVDLAPVQTEAMPPNCRIEVDDINLGLEHFYNKFDIVHARLISSGIKDYPGLIDHIARCLHPGGLIILYETDFRLYNPDMTLCAPWSTSQPEQDATSLSRWFFSLGSAMRRRGGHVDAADLLHTWVRQHHGFTDESIVHHNYWWPIGPLEYGTEGSNNVFFPREAVEMLRDDVNSFLRSGRPLLLGSGMDPADVDVLQTNAQRELAEAKIPMMVKIHCVYARKTAAE